MSAPIPGQARAFGGTMVGGLTSSIPPGPAPQAQPPQQAPHAAAPPNAAMKQTMVGTGLPPGPHHGLPPLPGDSAAPAGPVMGAPALHGGAMMGGAPGAQGSVTGTLVADAAAAATQPSPMMVGGGGGAAGPIPKSTMVGVALPGIAPTHGAPPFAPDVTAPSHPPPDPGPRAASDVPAVRVHVPEERPARLEGGPPKVSKGAWVLIAAASGLLVLGGAFALLWDPPRPMTAKVAATSDGSERLELACDDCPNGTVVKTTHGTATFSGGHAELALKEGLPVGVNALDVSVERPGMGRDEKVELAVPVAYRVRGDVSALSADPARLRVSVEAAKGASVVVDGKAIPLDAEGRGAYEIDVASELEGPKDVVAPLERKVPYSVKTADGETHAGEVALRIGITPLRVDAPGEQIVIDSEHFMLTGRTANEGVLTVSGRPITVDASGRFSQLMNVSSVGQTTIVVRAAADAHAPRTVRLKVKRVANLADEANVFRQAATTDYAQYASSAAPGGVQVAAHGRVVESRVDNYTTVAVVEVRDGCTEEPCLARVVHGAKLALERDQDITAFGRVARLVDGPRSHQRIPEIRADFVLTGDTKR